MSATPPPIDLTSLDKATRALHDAIGYWQAEPDDSGRKPHLRAGAIQAFEFSYELCMRFLRRVLIERALSADLVQDLSFNDLLRLGADAGLLPDPLEWRRWRELRNRTSHSYDEEQAQAIAAEAPAFLHDARALLGRLQAAMNHA
ncbi:HI0074 family nucleotidyltransferase substrate-binding subunit [Macromonas nakdongensis]|uniref:HI0074 family nucleotidyltransferase substrate-binding subunit n=1 Tax=Macromonas nakdongensis TaxID=1843082 RepID=UPI000C32E96F|nr:HI0074 family nucleotidyltransferase substrate-binding subunit [Macromonas nakdongensis]